MITAAVHAEVTTKLHHRKNTFHLYFFQSMSSWFMVTFNEISDVKHLSLDCSVDEWLP